MWARGAPGMVKAYRCLLTRKGKAGCLSHIKANDVQAISHANCWMYENTTRHDSSGLCEGKCICLQALYQKHCAMLPDADPVIRGVCICSSNTALQGSKQYGVQRGIVCQKFAFLLLSHGRYDTTQAKI